MTNPFISSSSSSVILILSLILFFSCWPTLAQNNSPNVSRTVFDVGVVLDLKSLLGKMSKICISMALDDFYTTHSNHTTKLILHWRDSNQDDMDAAASMALDLLKDGQVKAIIGPQTSLQAQFMAELGVKYHVPILSFSTTSPLLSPIRTPYFIRTALSDSSQVKAIAAVIEAFGWREVVQIYEDIPYGNGVIPDLTEALQEVKARVTYTSVTPYPVTDDEIAQELYKMATMQTRVFIVHLSPSLSSRLFLKANELGMMSQGYVWIITDWLANLLDSMNSSVIQSMQGVMGVRTYIPESKELDNFKDRWKRKFLNENLNFDRVELNIFGLWAYDTVWALAKAIERVGTENSHFLNPQAMYSSTDLPRLCVSEIGPGLRDAILKINFKGLSGQFNLTNGQLESSAFEIVNVIGKGDRVVGFWTPNLGLHKKLNTGRKDYSASKDDLNPIIWPGESMSIPKGWALHTRGKKLRIGVPKKYGFTEFVNVTHDPKTIQPDVSGYSIDVFKAVINELPYPIKYEFVPFEEEDGKQAGTYDDLIYQVHLKNFDAVVGDVTITANRSHYVDFTLPYIESGVTLVVLANENRNKGWMFLKPLSSSIWLFAGAYFLFTGFVVWVLEHRVNEEFRGPRAEQVGATLWFIFSTLVFAHREKLVSNWSRLVLLIWIFVMWILLNSYSASLSSQLAFQKLQPAVNDIGDLIKKGENVGYRAGSFVVNLLRSLNVEESKLKDYATAEEFGEALSNRTVGAIVDEIPYLKLFLAKNGNCDKYKMVGAIYRTDGFGFAFPIGSPLVPDMSRAILSVTEGPTMNMIEKKWLVLETTCGLNQPLETHSGSLDLNDFWLLFLITGAVSILALSIYLLSFIYNNRDVLITCDSSVSLHQRFRDLIRRFDERDLTHHSYTRLARKIEVTKMVSMGTQSLPPVVDASVEPASPNPKRREPTGPNPKRQDYITVPEAEDDAQHFKPLDRKSLARRRWNDLSKAWRFRSIYARLHEI